MSLLSLPPEIVVLIFDHLTPEYLNTHPETLYISKKWYTYALPTAIKSLRLLPKHLPRFPPENEDIYQLIQSYTTSVSLTLRDHFTPDQLRSTNLIELTNAFKSELSRFSATLTTLKQLKTFSFIANYVPSHGNQRGLITYLWDESMYTLISSLPTKTLTSLTLDTIGSKFLTGTESSRPRWHLCTMMKEFVALRVLKVRMVFMCGEIFHVGGEESPLEDIVVNVLRAPIYHNGCCSYNVVNLCGSKAHRYRSRKAFVCAMKEALKGYKKLKRCAVLSYHTYEIILNDCENDEGEPFWGPLWDYTL